MQGTDEYQRTAALYDFLFSRTLRGIRAAIRANIRRHKSRTIIDICCGTGEQLRLLHNNTLLLTGVDLSAAMLTRARKTSPRAIHYLEADAANLPLPDHSFDAVTLTLALHEKTAPQREAIFAEAWRILNKDGILLVADYCTPLSKPAARLTGQLLIPTIERLAGRDHYHNYQAWMKEGAIDGFFQQMLPGNIRSGRPHCNGSIKLCVASKSDTSKGKTE